MSGKSCNLWVSCNFRVLQLVGYCLYYIFVVFVQDSNFAGIRVGLTDEELKLCISETTLSGGKIMRQSFRPKIAGRGIEQNAMDFFQMKKKGKEIAAKTANRPQFMDGLGIYNI